MVRLRWGSRGIVRFGMVVLGAALFGGQCPPNVSLTLTPQTLTLEVEESGEITAAATDPLDMIQWESDAPETATVFDGVVTALAEGVATITAMGSNSGLVATATVTVVPRTTPLTAPAAPVLDPAEESTADNLLLITGTAEANAAIEVLGGASPAETIADSNGFFDVDVSLHANRLNRLFVTAIGPTGLRSAPATVALTQDGQEPSIFIDFPQDGSEVFDERVDVLGRVSDMLSGFMGLDVRVNGEPAEVDIGIGTNGTFLRANVPLSPGANILEATATDFVGNVQTAQVSVTRSEVNGPRISVVSGNDQTGQVKTELAAPVVVEVLDANDAPVAGCALTWHVARSDGRLTDTSGVGSDAMTVETTTDAQGRSQLFWFLGMDAGSGNNRLEISAACAQNTAFVCASATPAPPRQINVGSGNNQKVEINSPAPAPLRVWVGDGNNPVAGVPVTFTIETGDGFFNGQKGVQTTTVESGATGHAEVIYTLGDVDGHNTILADFDGNETAPAAFDIVGMVREFETPTTFTGRVLDNASCALGGATVELIAGQDTFTTLSDVEGNFSFEDILDGFTLLRVDGQSVDSVNGEPVAEGSYPGLEFETSVVPDTENSLGMPVLLPRLNPSNARVYDGTQDVVLGVEGLEGVRLTIKAGSMTLSDGTRPSPENPVTVSVDQVHFDDVPMPGPDGARSPIALTFQPPNAQYDPPVEVQYPNVAGLEPGAVMNFLQFNHDTGRFEIVSTGSVSDDGSVMTSDAGSGLPFGGWGYPCPPYLARGKTRDRCGIVGVVLFTGGTEFQDAIFAAIGLNFSLESVAARAREVDPKRVRARAVRASTNTGIQLLTGGLWLKQLRDSAREADCDTPKVLLVGHSLGGDTVRQSEGLGADRRIALDPIARELALPFTCQAWQRNVSFPAPSNTLLFLASDLTPAEIGNCFAECNGARIGACLRGYNMPGAETITLAGSNHNDIVGRAIPSILNEVQLLVNQVPKGADSGKGDAENIWLNETFTLMVGGQSYQPDESGFFFIENVAVPDEFGPGGPGTAQDRVSDEATRITGVGEVNGETWYVTSAPFFVRDGQTSVVEDLIFTRTPPVIPASLRAQADAPVLAEIGATTQMRVTATFADGSTEDVSGFDDFTTYRTSNGRIATVDQDGVVTAVREGTVFITATNFGATAVTRVSVVSGNEVTSVAGTVETTGGAAVSGADVSVVNLAGAATTNATGAFTIPAIPATLGNVVVTAQRIGDGPALAGVSAALAPVPNGETDAGTVTVMTLCERHPGNCDDADQDGVRDVLENGLGLIVGDADSDGDGIPDGAEDADLDGLSNLIEDILGTNPANFDTDQDGVSDGDELQRGLSPTDSDLDGDGLNDGEDDEPLTPDTMPPQVTLTSPAAGAELAAGETVAVRASATDNGRVSSVEFFGNGASIGTDQVAPYEAEFVVPTAKGNTVTLEAVATDTNGNTATTGPISFPVSGDPGTTVTGTVVDELDAPVEGASVSVFELETTTNAAGAFNLADVPTTQGDIVAEAEFTNAGGAVFAGRSVPTEPVRGGVTDVGEIVLRPAPLFVGRKYPLPGQVTSVATADLNEDGIIDVVTNIKFLAFNGTIPEQLALFFGNGDGTLQPETRLEIANSPAVETVRILDANGDDLLDIVTIKGDTGTNGEIGVLLGQETKGTFGEELRSPLSAGNRGVSADFADFDGDGDLDFVVAGGNTTEDGLDVLLGNGDGTFQAGTGFPTGTNVVGVATGDFDEDGAPDIAEVNFTSGNVGLLFNNADGTGTFQPAQFILQNPDDLQFPTAVAVADLDADDHLDLAVTFGGGSFSPAIVVALGNGDGTFRDPTFVDLPSQANPVNIVAADLDGDGVLDLVNANQRLDTVSVALGVGDGTFEVATEFPAGHIPDELAVADMDRDGDLDVIVGNRTSQDVYISFNDGAGNLTPFLPFFPSGGTTTTFMDVADLNGDGVLDPVTVNRNSSNLSVFLGRADGTFEDGRLVTVDAVPTAIAFGRFNGDEDIDAVVPLEPDFFVFPPENGNSVQVLLGNGDGTFTAQMPMAFTQGTRPAFVTVGRFNGDAIDDFAVAMDFGDVVAMFLGNGDGTFDEPVFLPVSDSAQMIAAADVNDDTFVDLIVGVNSFPGGIDVLFGDGEGDFSAPSRVFNLVNGLFSQSIEVADLDDDGAQDLVLAVGFSNPIFAKGTQDFVGGLFLLWGDGGGTFTQVDFQFAGTDIGDGKAVDIDGDGVLDLVAASGNARDVSVLLGNGKRQFQPEQRFNLTRPSFITTSRGGRLAVYDANNDGRSDIVAAYGHHDGIQTLFQREN